MEIPGYQVIQSLGVARGLTVRTPNAGKQIFAGFAAMGGGESSVFMEMAEKARETALVRLLEHAASKGGNAVLGVREVMTGMTEVLAYGTVVLVAPL
ncbi:hypothetical protein HDV05_004895 [Chytridiales sp. JEL 0842]|nr:hypothetical protein HDV05_004895 [Chytridiales sp. JEL 0842]